MVQLTHTIQDPMGFHARLVALVAAEARRWESKITVSRADHSVAGDNAFALMGLDARQGDELIFTFEGPDEEDALEFMSHVVRSF